MVPGHPAGVRYPGPEYHDPGEWVEGSGPSPYSMEWERYRGRADGIRCLLLPNSGPGSYHRQAGLYPHRKNDDREMMSTVAN